MTTNQMTAIVTGGRKCEVDGCANQAESDEYISQFSDEHRGWWCWDHAKEQGFCPMCGYFVLGIDDFQFANSDVCGECLDHLKGETGEYYDEDDEDDYLYFDFYPQPWYDPDSDLDQLEDTEPTIYIGPENKEGEDDDG